MFGSNRAVRRFSLLLLEEGESYVKDWVAHCSWPAEVPGNWQHSAKLPGQLRLCTKSLFFEPDDVRIPIVRLPFAHLQGLEGGGERSFTAASHRVIRMKSNAADTPYLVDRELSSTWQFELAYAGLEEFMPLAQQMLLASRLPPVEQEEFLEAFLQQQESGLHFDAAHLRSPALEAIALELPATSLTPLVREPGRVVVSDARLYFQPQHNVTGDAAVYTHPLAAVAAVARRRSSLRDVGVEVFFLQPGPDSQVVGPFWGAASAFFAFKTLEEREAFVGAIMGQQELGSALPGGRRVAAAGGSILEAEVGWLRRATSAWQLGHITNFQYLMFCNLAAGRSFNDLTQYPVFPWVLSDYESEVLDLDNPGSFRDLSQPVGALNPVRLAMFQRRFAEMPDDDPSGPPFLYGTHYSCPGYVMFWLVRAAPAHMLKLQNGRFDAPDRLFCSVRDSWHSVLANPTDVKELIPEFYMQRPDFLLNRHKLPLGSRQNGKPVGDVELPRWAQGSAERFLEGLRAALEAPFVSANLSHWIDLIFGYQQQGQAAVEANNVFRHLTYEGAVDTESVSNRLERLSLQTQVNEFGQCPRELFKHPHPPRLVCPPAPALGSPSVAAPQGVASTAWGQTAGGVGGEGAGQALSLALVSTLVAAAAESESLPPLEVPPLLQQMDMVRWREEQEARDLKLHGPVVSRATVIVEDFGASSADSLKTTGDRGYASDRDAAGTSPYSRLRSWANEHGAVKLGERLGAIRGALGDAVNAPPGDRASAIRGLFKRSVSSGSASGLSGEQPEGKEGSEEFATRAASASVAEGLGAGGPTSPVASRVSSFTASLTQRFQSLASTISSPQKAAGGSGSSGVLSAKHSGESFGIRGTSDSRDADGSRDCGEKGVSAGQDVLAGLMRWKYSSRQPPPLDDSSGDEGEEKAGLAGDAVSHGVVRAVLAAQPSGHEVSRGSRDEPSASARDVSSASHPAMSPRQKLLESQRQRMLREREASTLHLSETDAAATAVPEAAGHPENAGTLATAGIGRRSSITVPEIKLSSWGPGLRDRLAAGRVFAAGGEAVNAVALAEGGGSCVVYCVGHGGVIKLFDLHTGDQMRSTNISSQPVASLALFPPVPTQLATALPLTSLNPFPATASSSAGVVSTSCNSTLPLALCGCYDGYAYAYSVELGRVTASFQAHSDTVSCLAWLGSPAGGVADAAGQRPPPTGWTDASRSSISSRSDGRLRLATGSWDCSVRVWDLGDPRQLWGARPGVGSSPLLLATLTDLPGGVWAMAASADGNLLLTGTEDGYVTAWDLCNNSPAKLWERALSQDYIGGVALTPDADFAVVAAADGNLSLLELRRGGAVLSCVACGPPLRCCATDGELAVAGAEDGTLHFWDLAQQRGRVPSGGGAWTPPGPDGLYEPLRCSPPSPVNALTLKWLGAAGGEGRGYRAMTRAPALFLVTGHEGGVLQSRQAQG